MSTILVIDEHRVYRRGIRELIEAKVHGAQVVEASDSAEAAWRVAVDGQPKGGINESW